MKRLAWILVPILAASLLMAAASDGAMKTEIIFLTAMPAKEAAALYKRVLGSIPGTRVVVGSDPHTLVVHDTPGRIASFHTLLDALDVPAPPKMHIYVRPVLYRTPSTLARLALEVISKLAPPGVLLLPDDDAGKLIVRSTPAFYDKLDKLLRKLDLPARARRDIGANP